MITAKCPLRISLAGGGSDLDAYRSQFGASAIVSFSSNLYTYVTVFRDVFGQNKVNSLYNVNYSKVESVKSIKDIANDVAREAAKHFNSKPFSCWFTSDIPSYGSGLASSSSYMLSMLKALSSLEKVDLNTSSLIETSWQIEKKFNSLTGFQDPYGCALGGLNFLEKSLDNPVRHEKLDHEFLSKFRMFLLPTNVCRSSTTLLKTSNTWSFNKGLLDSAYDMRSAILAEDTKLFVEIFTHVWKMKKCMSPEILNSEELQSIDNELETSSDVLCHRLIGAGGGGYFFVICKDERSIKNLETKFDRNLFRIFVDLQGIRSKFI